VLVIALTQAVHIHPELGLADKISRKLQCPNFRE
jgi:hypothetical protein